MERSFTLLILLLLAGQVAKGQSKQQPGSLQPPVPVAERHPNPDFAAPDPKQATPLTRYLESATAPEATAPGGMPFRISTDGRWLIIGQQRVEINNGELLLREVSFQMGLFGGPPLQQPFSTTRQ